MCVSNNGCRLIISVFWNLYKIHIRVSVVEYLFQSLPKLLRHSFIATQQWTYLWHLIENLPQSQCIVLCDFSENCAFVIQDAAQGFHWNNAQATIHSFVIYYVDEETKKFGSPEFSYHFRLYGTWYSCCSFISAPHDWLLKQSLPYKPEKLKYFYDGAASQYKNKSNFLNLCNHEKDFGI